MSLAALCFWPRRSPDDAQSNRSPGRVHTRENRPLKKYRRFTGRRCAPNTGKVIEIAKEKARALNRQITGPENRKNREINRTIAPVSGRALFAASCFCHRDNRRTRTTTKPCPCGDLARLKSKARPKRCSGRANVTLHLLPCPARADNASGIQSIPTIQGCADATSRSLS